MVRRGADGDPDDAPPSSGPVDTSGPTTSGSYEAARDALADIVVALEAGGLPLEESLVLWERGEALARECERWLAGARERLERGREAAARPPS